MSKRIVFLNLFSGVFLTIVMFCSACGSCDGDKEMSQLFEKHIDTIRLRYNILHQNSNVKLPNDGTNAFLRSLGYLNALTGYERTNALNHYASYVDSVYMNEDIALWKSWYEENKCGLTVQKADEIVEKNVEINNAKYKNR